MRNKTANMNGEGNVVSQGINLGKGPKADVQAMQDGNKQGLLLFKITGEKGFLKADEFYTTTFTTLNGSGVTGEAVIGYDVQTRTITVAISASGLEANQVHIQHIHGFPDGPTPQTPP